MNLNPNRLWWSDVKRSHTRHYAGAWLGLLTNCVTFRQAPLLSKFAVVSAINSQFHSLFAFPSFPCTRTPQLRWANCQALVGACGKWLITSRASGAGAYYKTGSPCSCRCQMVMNRAAIHCSMGWVERGGWWRCTKQRYPRTDRPRIWWPSNEAR